MNRCNGPPRARAELTAMTVNPQTASQRRKRLLEPPRLRKKSDEDAEGQPNRLLMARRKGNAVAWVHEPAELPFLPGPDHELERRLSTELAGATPRRTNTRFEFHLLRQVERMPEQQVKVPFSVAAIVEERRKSGFHHEVVFDRLELDCCRGTEAGPAAHVPRTSTTKFKDGNGLFFFRQGCTGCRGYGEY